MMGTEDARNM